MAIKWVDYSNVTNGSGTYASPYNGTATFPLVDNDEVRVKSVTVDTATEFTFTGKRLFYTNHYRIVEIASTTNLSIGDAIYGEDRMVGRITAVGTDYVDFYSQAGMPFVSVNDNTMTFRKIKDEYVFPTHNGTKYLGDASVRDNITVSDGWTTETSRTTNGTVGTFVTSSSTDTNYDFQIKNMSNSSIDLSNTSVFPSSASTTANANFKCYGLAGSTVDVYSIVAGNTTGLVYLDSASVGVTLNIARQTNYYSVQHSSSTFYAPDCVVNIDKAYYYTAQYMRLEQSDNATINFNGAITAYTIQSSMLFYPANVFSHNDITKRVSTVNLNCPITFRNSVTVYAVTDALVTHFKVNLGSNFSMIESSSLTPITEFEATTYSNAEARGGIYKNTLQVNNASAVTVPSDKYRIKLGYSSTNACVPVNKGTLELNNYCNFELNLDAITNKSLLTYPTPATTSVFTDPNTSKTWEAVTSRGTSNSIGNLAYSTIFAEDTTEFNLGEASIKGYLQSFSASYCGEYYKTVQVPLRKDLTYTITGSVKSEVGFLDSVSAVIAYDGYENYDEYVLDVGSTESGWTDFSLTFTSQRSQMGLFKLAFKPKTGGKSLWLADLKIV